MFTFNANPIKIPWTFFRDLELIILRFVWNQDPWVMQRFGACLWPRARSCKPRIESHVRLLVHGACFSLWLCLCLSLSLSVCDYHNKKRLVWNQKRPWIARRILKKTTISRGITMPDFRVYYKAVVQDSVVLAQKQTNRWVEQKRDPRIGPWTLWSTNIR